MTTDEIAAKAKFLADNLKIQDASDRDYLERMIRTLVSEAYEEAAQVADASSGHTYEAHVGRVSASIAKDIRALKDSLTAETTNA